MSQAFDPEQGPELSGFDFGCNPVITVHYEPSRVGDDVFKPLVTEVMLLDEGVEHFDDERVYTWEGKIDGKPATVVIEDTMDEVEVTDAAGDIDEVEADVVRLTYLQMQDITAEEWQRLLATAVEFVKAEITAISSSAWTEGFVELEELTDLLAELEGPDNMRGLTISKRHVFEYRTLPGPYDEYCNMTTSQHMVIEGFGYGPLVLPVSEETDDVNRDTLTLEDLDIVEKIIAPLPLDGDVAQTLAEVRREPVEWTNVGSD